MQEIHDALTRHPIIIGLLGGLVAAVRSSPGTGWCDRALNVVCGAILSAYLGPALAVWLGMDSVEQISAVIFLTGMAGMTVVGGILIALRKIEWKTIIESWLKKGE